MDLGKARLRMTNSLACNLFMEVPSSAQPFHKRFGFILYAILSNSGLPQYCGIAIAVAELSGSKATL